MAGTLTLRVITPDRIVVDETADSIQVPGIDGLMGILPRHAGMVTALDQGELTYRSGGEEKTLFVSGGFAEVRGETVRIVSEAGERPDEIDEERARDAERRARERLDRTRMDEQLEVDLVRAQAALRRALIRQRLSTRRRP